VRRYRASGKSIATSIDAYAQGAWDESLKAYRMDASTLQLNQIDLAPADRAGIPDLAVVPHLTAEMATPKEDVQQESTMTEKVDLLQELQKIKPQKGWTARNVSNGNGGGELDAIRETLGAPQGVDLVQEVKRLRQQIDNLTQQAIYVRITELVSDKDRGVKVDWLRGMVIDAVYARQPQSIEEAERAYYAVLEMPSVKSALQAAVQAALGPSAIVNGRVRDAIPPKLEDTPENRQAALSQMGINI
jgi:hypothetical protein